MACDVRIAQRGDYDIGMPEINIGIPAGAGGTQRLPRLIGTARALEHMMAARMFKPEEAERIGLVGQLADDALEASMTLARRLIKQSPVALGYIKTLIRRALDVPLSEGLQLERSLSFALITSDHALERMAEINAGKRDLRDV
jgi:enoyl-CoA hydratase